MSKQKYFLLVIFVICLTCFVFAEEIEDPFKNSAISTTDIVDLIGDPFYNSAAPPPEVVEVDFFDLPEGKLGNINLGGNDVLISIKGVLSWRVYNLDTPFEVESKRYECPTYVSWKLGPSSQMFYEDESIIEIIVERLDNNGQSYELSRKILIRK